MRRRALRAAPRAVFAITTIRLQSLTPSRLRRCALRLPPGEIPTGYPRRALLGVPEYPEPAAPDRLSGCLQSVDFDQRSRGSGRRAFLLRDAHHRAVLMFKGGIQESERIS